MKSRPMLAVLMITILVLPAKAQTNTSSTTLAQFLQTGEIPVSMSEVVNMMLDQNLDIRSNRLGPRSSRLQSLVFYKVLQPSITISGTVSRDSSASTSQLNGASTLSQLRQNFSAGFAQTLPTGTTVGATLTMNRLSSNSSLNTYNPSYTGRATYSISQHLLQNRGRDINLRQIHQSENNEKIADTQFEIQVTNLLVTAQKAYWDLVFAAEDLKVKQDSLELAQKTLEENRMRVEIGTMARFDIIQTQSDVATRSEALIISTSAQTQAEDQIKKLVTSQNDPTMFLMKLRASDAPKLPDAAAIPNLASAIQIALENRPELRQAALDLQNKDIDVEYTRNQKLPVLDFTASYTQNGTGGVQTVRGSVLGSTQVLDVIPGGIFDSFGQIVQNKYSGYSVGFSLIIPLKNRAAEADYSRAVNERRLSDSKIDATTQQIALEVRNALTQVQMNRARIDTAQVGRDLAQQKLEAEQARFNLGTSTLRFVLDEQRNVALAKTNELQVIINLTESMVDLDRAMGVTLKKNNIEVEKALQPNIASSGVKRPAAGN